MNYQRIAISGSTGFVGKNLTKYLFNKNQIYRINRYTSLENNDSILKSNIIIHLAGKAHDSIKIKNSSEYYQVNTDFTKKVFDSFIISEAKLFITLSSVKAIADEFGNILTEDIKPNPMTHYGKSKLLAEQYILSKEIPKDKRFYILRPCMIYGPSNKGNLNLLYQMVSKNIPWPLGAFENKRSFCSIENLLLIIHELIEREDIPSGVYNVADDDPLSTNDLINLIGQSMNKKPRILKIPKILIKIVAIIGDKLFLPLNSERLNKLTSSYTVCNKKIKTALGKPLLISSREGLLKTFKSFNN